MLVQPELSDLAARFDAAGAATGGANAYSTALAAARAAGTPLLDLTTASPAECGLAVSPEPVAAAYARALAGKGRTYDPDPLGHIELREAVARWYAAAGVAVSPAHVVITPGTSLAYLYLFRLLARPGDTILRPRPGYPLFEDIAAIAG